MSWEIKGDGSEPQDVARTGDETPEGVLEDGVGAGDASFLGDDEAGEVIELGDDPEGPLDSDGEDDGPMDADEDKDEGDAETGFEPAVGPGDSAMDIDAHGSDGGAGLPDADDSIAGFWGHGSEPVYAAACSPDGSLVISGGGDDKAWVWRTDSGQPLFDLAGHTDSVVAVAFSADGKYCASGGMDGRILVYTVASGELLIALEGPSEVTFMTFHPKGAMLLVGSTDPMLWLFSLPTGTIFQVLSGGHMDSVTCGDFTPGGKFVFSGSQDGSCVLWDPKLGAILQKFAAPVDPPKDDGEDAPEPPSIVSLHVNADASVALAGTSHGSVLLLNLASGYIIKALPGVHGDESVEAVRFLDSPSLGVNAFVSAGVDGRALVWESGGKIRGEVRHHDAIIHVVPLPGSPRFLTSSADKTVTLWDARTCQAAQTWRGHTQAILDMTLGKDPTNPAALNIITAGDDGSCLIFNIT